MGAFNKSAVTRIISDLKLFGGNQAMAEHWLSLWQGDALASRTAFSPHGLEAYLPNLLLFDIVPDRKVTVRLAGTRYRRLLGRELQGIDWIADAPQSHRATRLHNLSSVARGAILVARRRSTMRIGGENFNEEIVLPFAAGPDGVTAVLAHVIWPFDSLVTPESIVEIDPATPNFKLISLH